MPSKLKMITKQRKFQAIMIHNKVIKNCCPSLLKKPVAIILKISFNLASGMRDINDTKVVFRGISNKRRSLNRKVQSKYHTDLWYSQFKLNHADGKRGYNTIS